MDLHEVLLASRMTDKNNGNGESADFSNYYTKSQTDSRISEKVAEIVSNAPEDFDTLKEISDWIESHEDSAAAMNSAIVANTTAIAQKADKLTTYTKTETDNLLDGKVDKVIGKGLSTNDFTNEAKNKLDILENYDDAEIKVDISNVQEQIDIITHQIFGLGTIIPSGANLNIYTKPGIYYSDNKAKSDSLLNCPYTGSGFRLEVALTASADSYIQRLYPSKNCSYFFIRVYSIGVTYSWYKFSGEAVTTT